MPPPDRAALRRLVLAVAVLDDVDAEPREDGVHLGGCPRLLVPWADVRRTAAGADPDGPVARLRVARRLLAARLLADLPAGDLVARVRPIGFPVDDPLHPGLEWVAERVLGDVLDLGLGLRVATPTDPAAATRPLADAGEPVVLPLPADALRAAGTDTTGWWPDARAYLDRMGRLAVDAVRRDRHRVLRPVGDCDVVTLLASRELRAALAASDGTGLRAVAVPCRSRGWVDLARIDPAFTAAAAAATAVAERGFPRPVLVTADEVTVPPVQSERGLLRDALADPAAPGPALPPVLWR